MGDPALWVLLAAVSVGAPASANPFDVFEYGTRGAAMAGAIGAVSSNHAAVYYNPANLVLTERASFAFDVQSAVTQLELERTRPAPEGGETLHPGTTTGVSLAFVFPFGGVLEDRLTFAFASYIPAGDLFRLQSPDPAEPHAYMYHALPDRVVLAPALAFRFNDLVRVGVSLQILAAVRGDVDTRIDVTERRFERRTLRADLIPSAAPVLGIGLSPGPIRIGLTYRSAIRLEYELPIDFDFEEIGVVAIGVSGTSLYTPHQLNGGLAWVDESLGLTLTFDLTAALWSAAPDPATRIDAVLTDEVVNPEADEPTNVLEFDTPDIALGAADVLIPRVGAEWEPTEGWVLRAGYRARAPILPRQTGYTNFIDHAEHVFAGGVGVKFQDPLRAFVRPIRLEASTQLIRLVPRRHEKFGDADTLGVGSYRSRGHVIQWAAALLYEF